MKSSCPPQQHEVEVSSSAVIHSQVQASLSKVVLGILAFHLGCIGHRFLRVSPKLQEEPSQLAEKVAGEDFSMETLENLVKKLPDSDFRACLQMVIGTAYAERCDALNLHLRPFMKRILRDLEAEEEDQAAQDSQDESAEPREKHRKRKKHKNHETPKFQKAPNGLVANFIIQIHEQQFPVASNSSSSARFQGNAAFRPSGSLMR